MGEEKRRGQLDIIAEILRQCLRGEKVTRIVYRSNINFKRFKVYIEYLTFKDFLEVVEGPKGTKIYRTTDKGRHFLELLEGE